MRKLLLMFLCVTMLGCTKAVSEPTVTAAVSVPEVTAEPVQEAAEEAAPLYPFTFTDTLGTEVTLMEKPKKAAVLFSSYAEIWHLCGGEIAVTVGDSVSRGFAEEGTVLVNEGAGLKIDMEALIAAEPDLVIVTADLSAQKEAAEVMRSLGVPCAEFREENVDDYLTLLKLFAEINENDTAYAEYGEAVAKEIEEIKALAAGKDSFKYLFIRAGSGFSSTKAKTADDHFACVMIDELGGVNIAEAAGNLAEEISLESILEQDPDVIIIAPQGDEEASRAYMESLMAEPGWNSVRAIAEGRCYTVEKELFNYKPNARWAEAYRKVFELVFE